MQERKELRPVHQVYQSFDSTTDIPYVWNYDPVTSKTVMCVTLTLHSVPLHLIVTAEKCTAVLCVALFVTV
jgi:hypothetical protein